MSQTDERAVLACTALDGYHAVVSCTWELDGREIAGQKTPLLYCSSEGTYACHLQGTGINHTSNFKVSSKLC